MSKLKCWKKRTSRYDNPTWAKKWDKYGKEFIGVAKLGEGWTFTGLDGKTEQQGCGLEGRKKAMERAQKYMEGHDHC